MRISLTAGLPLLATLALAGCAAQSSEQLWPGPGWTAAPAAPLVSAAPAAPTRPIPAVEAMPAPTPARSAPAAPSRRGSSTPPDAVFRDRQRDDYQPLPPDAVQRRLVPPPTESRRDQVLAPRDPTSPYSADGYGYQRQGTTIQGPRGEVYNQVGPTLFGRAGRHCTTTGETVFC